MDEQLTNEAARLSALRRLEIIDVPHDRSFEHILEIVRTICEVPAAGVTLIDETSRIVLASDGFAERDPVQRESSICNTTISQREPLIINDTLADPRFAEADLVQREPFVRAYAGAPLVLASGHQIGSLCAFDYKPRSFTQVQGVVLAQLARCVVREMELRQRASTDAMTGFLSRAAFMAGLGRLYNAYTQSRTPAVLAILDLDHFKAINDQYGHAAGDEVLKRLSQVCHERFAEGALLGRLGGEEFGIALSRTGSDEAVQALSALLRDVAAIRLDDEPGVSVTASIGLAPMSADFSDVSSWCRFADAALYAAKHNGRNRLSVAQGSTMSQLVFGRAAAANGPGGIPLS